MWWAALDPAELAANRELFEESAEAAWQEPWGDRRQELAFIGAGLDQAAIEARLDACLLSEGEMAGGPLAWGELPDPLPAWAPVS